MTEKKATQLKIYNGLKRRVWNSEKCSNIMSQILFLNHCFVNIISSLLRLAARTKKDSYLINIDLCK